MEKNKNSGLIVLVILLVIGLVGSVGYIVYDKVLNKSDKVVKVENKESEKKEIKIDRNKELVYDADYKNKSLKKSYVDRYGNVIYLSDIRVPYINIKSEKIKKINKKLEKIYKEIEKNYNAEYGGTDNYCSSYDYVIIDNVLSIVYKYKYVSETLEYNYLTYNIDLDTFELLNYNDLLERIIKKYKIKKIDDNFVSNELELYYNHNNHWFSGDENFKNQSLVKAKEELNKEIKNNTVKCFYNSVGNINVIMDIDVPAGSGETNAIIELRVE